MTTVVRGAGPAGALFAVRLLSRWRQGLDTPRFPKPLILTDISREYRRPCGEAVPDPRLVCDAVGWNTWTCTVWDDLFSTYLAADVRHTVTSTALVCRCPGKTLARIDTSSPARPFFHIIDKKRLVHRLRRTAEALGAEIRYGDTETRPTVVACSTCAAAYRRGEVLAAANVVRAIAKESPVLDQYGVDAAIIVSTSLPGGYAWAWHTGSGTVNCGAGTLSHIIHPTTLLGIARELGACGKDILREEYSRIYWFKPINVLEKHNGLYYIGEAAGLVTHLAEGIRPALLSAYALAENNQGLARELQRAAAQGARLLKRVTKLTRSEKPLKALIAATTPLDGARPPSIHTILRLALIQELLWP